MTNALSAIANKYSLLDVTIKIYGDIFFFLFFKPPQQSSHKLCEAISRNIRHFADWDEKFIYDTVYDLQERFVTQDFDKWGEDYENR